MPLRLLSRSMTLLQHTVPVALSSGAGRGTRVPVPVLPGSVWWDCVSGAVCPPSPGRLRALLSVAGKR